MAHFTFADRQSLQLYLGEGYSHNAIGLRIGKDKSSTSREITGNVFNRSNYTVLHAEAPTTSIASMTYHDRSLTTPR